MPERLRIAIQKSGRLSDQSIKLLKRCGIHFELDSRQLYFQCQDFPLDIMFVRNNDIPQYLIRGLCDLGIIGRNVLDEKSYKYHELKNKSLPVKTLRKLPFGTCRLSIAIPKSQSYSELNDLNGKRIATSHPYILKNFLSQNNIDASIVELSGSVELAPTLNFSDAICDLISSGTTLRANGLKEVITILESQSEFIQSNSLSPNVQSILNRFLQRMDGVLAADNTKYVMMNAPTSSLAKIKEILPGMEEPTIVPLSGEQNKIAIHAVSHESVFWETMERLKSAGASSILVMPIEKIIA